MAKVPVVTGLYVYVVEEFEEKTIVNANRPKSPEENGGLAAKAPLSYPCVVKTLH